MPFLYSISRTSLRRAKPHHAQKPSSDSVGRLQSPVVRDTTCQRQPRWKPSTEETVGRVQSSVARDKPCQRHPTPSLATALRTVLEISTPHTTGFSRTTRHRSLARSTARKSSTKSFTTPLNPRRRPLGRRCSSNDWHSNPQTTIPGQTIRPNDGSVASGQSSAVSQKTASGEQRTNPRYTCPETHQNLIHISKEQRCPTGQHKRHGHTQGALPRSMTNRMRDIPRYLRSVVCLQAPGFRRNSLAPDN
jgi:hypothetical protein